MMRLFECNTCGLGSTNCELQGLLTELWDKSPRPMILLV
jgi:hypothetical protein